MPESILFLGALFSVKISLIIFTLSSRIWSYFNIATIIVQEVFSLSFGAAAPE